MVKVNYFRVREIWKDNSKLHRSTFIDDGNNMVIQTIKFGDCGIYLREDGEYTENILEIVGVLQLDRIQNPLAKLAVEDSLAVYKKCKEDGNVTISEMQEKLGCPTSFLEGPDCFRGLEDTTVSNSSMRIIPGGDNKESNSNSKVDTHDTNLRDTEGMITGFLCKAGVAIIAVVIIPFMIISAMSTFMASKPKYPEKSPDTNTHREATTNIIVNNGDVTDSIIINNSGSGSTIIIK